MPGPKTNNNRKYPDANHQPRQKAADRIGRSQGRQEFYDSLTLEQKIAALPPEPYSKKQRARLLAALAKQNAPKPAEKVEQKAVVGAPADKKETKKYMKGSK